MFHSICILSGISFNLIYHKHLMQCNLHIIDLIRKTLISKLNNVINLFIDSYFDMKNVDCYGSNNANYNNYFFGSSINRGVV